MNAKSAPERPGRKSLSLGLKQQKRNYVKMKGETLEAENVIREKSISIGNTTKEIKFTRTHSGEDVIVETKDGPAFDFFESINTQELKKSFEWLFEEE